MYKKKMETGLNINENIQGKKEFRNPRCDNSKDYLKKSIKVIVFCHVTLLLLCFSIYEKLIEFVEIDEKGTNYPPVSKKYNKIAQQSAVYFVVFACRNCLIRQYGDQNLTTRSWRKRRRKIWIDARKNAKIRPRLVRSKTLPRFFFEIVMLAVLFSDRLRDRSEEIFGCSKSERTPHQVGLTTTNEKD